MHRLPRGLLAVFTLHLLLLPSALSVPLGDGPLPGIQMEEPISPIVCVKEDGRVAMGSACGVARVVEECRSAILEAIHDAGRSRDAKASIKGISAPLPIPLPGVPALGVPSCEVLKLLP